MSTGDTNEGKELTEFAIPRKTVKATYMRGFLMNRNWSSFRSSQFHTKKAIYQPFYSNTKTIKYRWGVFSWLYWSRRGIKVYECFPFATNFSLITCTQKIALHFRQLLNTCDHLKSNIWKLRASALIFSPILLYFSPSKPGNQNGRPTSTVNWGPGRTPLPRFAHN